MVKPSIPIIVPPSPWLIVDEIPEGWVLCDGMNNTPNLRDRFIVGAGKSDACPLRMPFGAVLTATVLVSAFSSIVMGLYARNPILVAPGMSLNALMAATIVRAEGIPWRTALGCVFWAGLIFLILILLDRDRCVLMEVPPMLRFGLIAWPDLSLEYCIMLLIPFTAKR